MFRTDPQHLAWVLENLVAGHVVNQVTVQEPNAMLAKKALDNMFSVV
jgi:quinolinate synthase